MEQGGVETVVCDLVKALGNVGIWKYGNAGMGECGNGENEKREKWEGVVVSKGGRLVDRIEATGGRHVTLDLKSKNPLTYVSRVWKLRKILKDEKPDLVCVHSRVPAWLYVGVRALDAFFRKVNPSSRPAIPQSPNPPITQSPPPWITYAHGANSVSRYSEVMTKGDLVVTPSRFLADYLKANYGTPEEKIRIVPNAVDTERFDPANLDEAFIAEKRREWGIGPDDHVTMAIGRITPVKGLDNLIRDFATRGGEDTASPLKLVIVGGADKRHQQYLESLKLLAREVGRETGDEKRIVFAGQQSKIPECISIADEIVSANVTKPETFGLSVAEAYAMNKPVRVLRRFGGVAEVMDAVESSNCVTSREAVQSLYGLVRYAEMTRSVYHEALSKKS